MDYSRWVALWNTATPEQLIAPVFVCSLVTVLCIWYMLRYFLRSFALSRSLKSLNQTLAVLQSVVASTQGEAAGRSQYLQDLKQQGERLQALNREVNEYLDQISSVLGKGFNEFSEGMERSLRKTLGDLDEELGSAVTRLAGGVDTMKESLDDFSDIMERVQRK
jgi:DNA anti-recombination protein RmuC